MVALALKGNVVSGARARLAFSQGSKGHVAMAGAMLVQLDSMTSETLLHSFIAANCEKDKVEKMINETPIRKAETMFSPDTKKRYGNVDIDGPTEE